MKNKGMIAVQIIFLLVVCSIIAFADSGLSVSPAMITVKENEAFSYDLDISTTDNIQTVELTLGFDPSIIGCSDITEGGFLGDHGAITVQTKTIDNTTGTITYEFLLDEAEGISGDGQLVSVDCVSIAASGYSNLSVDTTYLTYAKNISGIIQHGESNVTSIENGKVGIVSDLVINEIMQNGLGGGSEDGEYFELYNPTSSIVDMDGYTIKDTDSDLHIINNSGALNINPGEYIVLCRNADPEENDGITDCAYEYSDITLNNGDDEVIILNKDGFEVDRVEFDGGPVFPDPADGYSMELIATTLDNNVGANWRDATRPFGSGSHGTPGMVNNQPPSQPVLEIPEDGAILNSVDVITNITATDDDNDLMSCYIYLGTELDTLSVIEVLTDVESGVSQENEISVPVDALYYWKVQCDDGIYNSTDSLTKSFEVDSTAPSLSNLNKTPEIVYNDNDVIVTVNVTDENLDSVWVVGNWTGAETSALASNIGGDMYQYTIDSSNLENQEVISWAFYANDSSDNVASAGIGSFQVENRAPVLISNDSIQWHEDTNKSISLTSYFNDPDSDDLTYTVVVEPETVGYILNETTGSLELIPTANYTGNDTIQFNAEDPYGEDVDSINLTLIVENTNDQPVFDAIGNRTAVQDRELTIDISAYANDIDPDDELNFHLVSGPGNIANATEGIYKWTPDHANYRWHEVTFSVSDGEATIQQTSSIYVYSTLNISNVNVNTVDIEDGEIFIDTIKPGSTITTEVELINVLSTPNIDNVQLSLESSQLGVSETESIGILSGGEIDTATFTFPIDYDTDNGTYEINIIATGEDHGDHEPRLSTFTYYVKVQQGDDEVIISSVNLGKDAVKCIGQTILAINVSNIGDYSQDFVNVTVEQSGLGLSSHNGSEALDSLETETYFFPISTENKAAGNYPITIKAIYYDSMFDQKEITLTIENCEPEFNGPIADITIAEGSHDDSINLSDYFTDYNLDTLSFGYEGAEDVTVEIANGLVNISSASDFNGDNYINFTASDLINTTKSESIMITITPINDAPTIESISNKIIQQYDNFTYQVVTDDVENDTLTYGLTINDTLPAAINQSGYISGWTATNNQVGNDYLFNVSVSDGTDTVYEDFIVSVSEINDAPEFISDITGISFPEDTINDSLNITSNFADIDGDDLTYEASDVDDITVSVSNDGIVTLDPALNFNGERNVTFRAFDSVLYSNWSNIVTLVVTPMNDAPELVDFNPPTSSVVDIPYIYQVNATDLDEDDFTFSAITDLAEFDISPEGLINFTPATVGQHVINITVTDLDGLADSEEYTITIYDKLQIKDVEAKVNDGSYESLEAGETLDDFVPGSNLTLRLTVKNWITDFAIFQLRINATLEDEAQAFKGITKLDPESEQQIILDLGVINSGILNGLYDLDIKAEGIYNPADPDDASAEWQAHVFVLSEENQVMIIEDSAEILPSSTIQCDREVEVSIDIKNLDAFGTAQETTVTISEDTLGDLGEQIITIPYDTTETFTIPINFSADLAAGDYELKITAETSTYSTEYEGIMTVEACEITYQPVETHPIVSGKEDTTFSFTMPNGLDFTSAIWKEDGDLKPDYNDQREYIFEAKGISEVYHVRVQIEDDQGATHIHDWYPETTMYPIAEPYTTEPDLSTLNQTQLESVNLTIINGNSKIRFLDPINLKDIVAFGDHIYLEPPVVGVNTSEEFYVFNNKAAQITLSGLTYNEEPIIYYSASTFTTDPSEITAVCPPSRCRLVSRTAAPTSNGIIVFNVTRFSSYRIGTQDLPPVPGNNNPVITTSAVTTATKNTTYTYDVDATDIDGDSLTYSVTGPSGMTISPSTGIISWNPSAEGSFDVTVSVSDGRGGSDTQSFTLRVGEDSVLTISDLDIKVGSDSDKDVHERYFRGYEIDEKAKPGDIIKFDIELENNGNEDLDNIEITVTAGNVNDDDLEDSEEIDEIKDGKDDSVTLEIEVPYLIDEGSYEIEIEVDAEGRDNDFTWELELIVDKEKHEILIEEADLSTSLVKCSRNVNLDLNIVNTGGDNEEDVRVTVKNDDLDIDFEDSDIELDEGEDDDSEFSRNYLIRVDEDIAEGTYPIEVKVYRDEDNLEDEETIYLTVEDCFIETTTPVTEEPEVEVITTGPSITPVTPTTSISFRNSSEYLTLLVILFVILLGGVVFLIGAVIILTNRR